MPLLSSSWGSVLLRWIIIKKVHRNLQKNYIYLFYYWYFFWVEKLTVKTRYTVWYCTHSRDCSGNVTYRILLENLFRVLSIRTSFFTVQVRLVWQQQFPECHPSLRPSSEEMTLIMWFPFLRTTCWYLPLPAMCLPVLECPSCCLHPDQLMSLWCSKIRWHWCR